VRWGRNGTWLRLLQILQANADARGDVEWDGASLDATHIKAHRASASGPTTEFIEASFSEFISLAE
jgi:hypothetical protein